MRRTLALFGAGTALGAVVMYFEGGDWAGPSSPQAEPAPRGAPLAVPSLSERAAPEAIDLLTLATGSASVAPQIDADRFRIEAALAKAGDDPAAALEDLLALPHSKAGGAFERLAVIWIERDVYGAMAHAETIADEALRNEFKAALTHTWAHLDPDAVVDYVVDLDADRRNELLRLGALQAFALVDPQRALQAADSMPGDLGAMLKRAALMSVAQDDPVAALRIAESLPSAAEREPLLSAIAASYGRTDPEAALAWAQSLDPPSPHLLATVLVGVAHVDPGRAIDLLFQTMDGTGQRGSGPLMALVANKNLSAEHTAALAERLLAAPRRSQELQMLTRAWAQREPHDAVLWLLANQATAPRNALGQAARELARQDPAAAIGYLDAVQPERRATWLRAVAEGYAQNDARAAARWIAPHRGEAGYDAAVAAIAAATASTDAAAAARLFDSIDTAEAPGAPQTAQRIAGTWARHDPRAAAAWAGAIAADDARVPAVREAAAQWAARDAAGARGWALGLPAGAARDAALTQLLGATGAGTVDHVVLDAFSTLDAQQRGVGDVVRMLAVRDPAGARRLADQYLTDPGARQAAEHFIERGRDGPPRLPSSR